MKKYDKIMGVFTVAISQLEALEVKNNDKANKLETKKRDVLAKASAKAEVLRDCANDLYSEGAAALKTIRKLKTLLS